MMRRRHNASRTARRGQSLVELALILPLVALILTGTVDFTRLLYADTRLANAVKEGALFGAYTPAYVSATDNPDPNNIVYRVNQESSGSLTLTNVTVTCYDKTTGGAKNCSSAVSGDTIEVRASYVFQPLTTEILGILGNGFTLTRTAKATVL